MKRLLLATIIVMLIIPSFYFSFPSTKASSDVAPFAPHEVKVLVVSPRNVYVKGGHYLISDLARYGFNITQHTSDNSTATDYRIDPLTSDLSQYDVVILHGGYHWLTPSKVSAAEVNHFTNYGGILIVIGNALFANETSSSYPYFWDNLFDSTPIQKLEKRLGVDFVDYLGTSPFQFNGTFTSTKPTFKGPSSLSYVTTSTLRVNFQVNVGLKEAEEIYSFTTTEGDTTSGVTYYRNSTGVTGIYIQGSYIYAPSANPRSRIRYLGLTNTSERSSMLASLIAHALDADVDTIIKPQPLASIRLDGLGKMGWEETDLNTSLDNFYSIIDNYGVTPAIAFTDVPSFDSNYWNETVGNVLSQLRGKYSDWEYSSSLRNENASSWTQDEIEALIRKIKGNYTALGMNLFSTISTLTDYWSQTTLDAMASENLYLLDVAGEPENPGLEEYYLDWWNIRVEPALTSNVIVHSGAQMGWYGTKEKFTEINPDPIVAKDTLHYEYFKDRDKWALAVVNGFPSFVYDVKHFRSNEVGTYSLQTVIANLTSEIPDIRFVPLVEAGLYFGNKWMSIENTSRVGSVVEFDVDASAIPTVANIGKGMLWLRINANETIQGVLIDGKPWYYFDDHSIRVPVSAENVHMSVTLGDRMTPTVFGTVYKVVDTKWDVKSFDVTATSMPSYNVTVRLLVPEVGAFVGDQWNVFCSEPQDKWGYRFDASSRILLFWAISDGSVTFQAGPDVVPPVIWGIDLSPTNYDVSVTVRANVTDLQTDIENATLGYSVSLEWVNVTMVPEGGFYFGEIPSFPYGTVVYFRLYVSDNVGNWLVTEIFSYNVTDTVPPDVETPEWGPASPSPGESVFVRVSVREPENASGVQSVMLSYFLDGDMGTLESVEMTLEGEVWWAYIPGQGGGSNVTFFVSAFDNKGNVNKTEDISYTVAGTDTSVSPMFVLLVTVPVIVVAVGIALYFVKFRKVKLIKRIRKHK